MEHLIELIRNHFPILIEHKYIFLFISSSLEGMNTMVVAGFLVSIGGLAFIPAALICLAGEIINSYLWYGVGYFGGSKSIEWFIRNSPRKKRLVEKIRSYLEGHTGKILLIGKVTFSITIVILILIGSTKYSLKKFTFYNFFGSILWIIITFTIGHFFGQGYKYFVDYLQNISYLILFIGIILILTYAAESMSSLFISRALRVNDHLRRLNSRIKEGMTRLFNDPDSPE